MPPKPYRVILYSSFIYLLFRGLRYAFIGSYLPLWIPAAFLLYFILVELLSLRTWFRVGSIVWAVFLCFWVFIRFLTPILMAFSPQVTEAHIRDQFNVWQFSLNLGHLALAYLLLTKRK